MDSPMFLADADGARCSTHTVRRFADDLGLQNIVHQAAAT